MKREYFHYETWEDWKDGLYNRTNDSLATTVVERAARVLRDGDMLLYSMRYCAFNWVHSAAVNLTNRSRNRQAWLGQAACCFVVGASETLTKEAWHTLTPAEQMAANTVADTVIKEYEYAKDQKWN